MENVESYLKQLLLLAQPLAPLDLPLLDAHGATLASDIEVDLHILGLRLLLD